MRIILGTTSPSSRHSVGCYQGRKDRLRAVFSLLASRLLIRTIVFIDGYNLYYGRLRGSAFKWLDVVSLVSQIVRIQHGSVNVERVHYFTAPAKEAFASLGKASVIAQQSYHRALEAKYPPHRFEITLGNHAFDRGGSWMPRYIQGKPCDKSDRVLVWALEEKQTDINIALAMYRTCCRRDADQVVICSNDSDMEPALKAIREDFPSVQIGVISPVPPHDGGRRFSKALAAQAHWVRRHITDEELQDSQLPLRIATRKKPVRKPDHW